jgi:hypothetical protein
MHSVLIITWLAVRYRVLIQLAGLLLMICRVRLSPCIIKIQNLAKRNSRSNSKRSIATLFSQKFGEMEILTVGRWLLLSLTRTKSKWMIDFSRFDLIAYIWYYDGKIDHYQGDLLYSSECIVDVFSLLVF